MRDVVVPAVLGLAASACFALAFGLYGGASPQSAHAAFERPEMVQLWVDAAGGPRPVREGELLADGDRVQVVLEGRPAAFAALAGRDHTELLEVYGGWAVGKGGPAPFALELDDSPNIQELYLVLADHALSSQEVRDAVARGSMDVREMHLQKR